MNARERPENERSDYLERACGSDHNLRREVESLLRAGEEDHTLFNEPLFECHLQPGRRLGPYLIIRELGRGGMGTVYLAKQEKPVQRLVAIKFIGFLALDEERLARFQVEQKLLAQMTHSNIAKLYESGTTLDGFPYFVMEYIDGMAITAFCDQHRLNLQARLELFSKVCEALNGAHLKGVIHRDIKPANILVLMENGIPTPKIIDFGIAKPFTASAGLTKMHNQPGTPRYMSPEQIGMTNTEGLWLEPDFRTDVYNLGVLLYELLVGVYPLEWYKNPDREKVRRSIRWDDPIIPSLRWDRLSIEVRTNLATQRDQSLGSIKRLLKGDLEWIVMRALEKEPKQRYQSIGEMSADLQRYRHGLPIDAGPPTLRYRMSKFIRRYRWIVTTASSLFLVLIAFAIVLSIQNQQILMERDRARQERDTASEVTEFMVETLGFVDPYRQESNGSLQVNTLLERARNRISKDKIKAPQTRAKLAEALATVHASLGKHDEAIQLYLEADRLAKKEYGYQSFESARIRILLADSYLRIGHYDQAVTTAEHAVMLHRKNRGATHADTSYATTILGTALIAVGRLREAEEQLLQAIIPIDEQPNDHIQTASFTHTTLGFLYYQQGHYQAALDHLKKGYALKVRIKGKDHLETAASLSNLSAIAFAFGKYQEAETNWSQALVIHKRNLGRNHPMVALIYNNLAMVAEKTHDFERAEHLMRKALGIRTALGQNNTDFAEQYINLGQILYAKEDLCGAIEAIDVGLEMLHQIVGKDHYLLANGLNHLSRIQKRLGNYRGALLSAHEALNVSQNQASPAYQNIVVTLLRLASLHNALGNYGKGEDYAISAFQWLDSAIPPDHSLHQDILGELATAWIANGQYSEAEPILLERQQTLNQAQGPNAESAIMAQKQLAKLYQLWKKDPPPSKTPLPTTG